MMTLLYHAKIVSLGFYWIDPNLGMSDDAVKVFCDMTDGGKTCVFPDVHASKMPNIPWRKSGDGWYSNLRGGFRISYDSVGKVQVIQWCTSMRVDKVGSLVMSCRILTLVTSFR